MPTVHGADISHYQAVDWEKFPQLAFVACKATEGTGYVDPTFKANWAAMRRRAFGCRVAYHFLNRTDPVAQARFFQATVGDLQSGETLALDFESAGVTADEGAAFLTALKLPNGHTPLFYGGEYFPGVHDARLQRYPLWLPQYAPKMTTSRHVVVWQFSSGGAVAGIPGRVDVNEVVDLGALLAACGCTPKPTPAATVLVADTKPPAPPTRREVAADLLTSLGDLPVPMSPLQPPPSVLSIIYLQRVLNLVMKSGLTETGVYDPVTCAAVWSYQQVVNRFEPGAIHDAFPGVTSNLTKFWFGVSLTNIKDGKA